MVKNAFKKVLLLEDNQCNFVFFPSSVSEIKKDKTTNKNALVITALLITGNNEIRLLTFMFTISTTKEEKKSNKHTI